MSNLKLPWFCLAQGALLWLALLPANGQDAAVSPGSTQSKTVTIESQSTSSGPGATASQSSEVIIERKGIGGIRSSNVFRPKYKERLTTYGEQVDLGVSRGWLTGEEAAHFKQELARLSVLESEASAHGFPKPELDNLERQFTQFNMELHKASNKPAGSTSSTSPEQKPASKPMPPPAVPAPAPLGTPSSAGSSTKR